MQLFLCAVRDSAVSAFQRPFVVPALGMAIRAFGDEVVRPESELAKHPSDYELFHLGSFDEESGKVVCLPNPRSMARAVDFVKPSGGVYDASS